MTCYLLKWRDTCQRLEESCQGLSSRWQLTLFHRPHETIGRSHPVYPTCPASPEYLPRSCNREHFGGRFEIRVTCSAHDVNGVPDNKELRLSMHPRTMTVGHRRQHTKATMNSPHHNSFSERVVTLYLLSSRCTSTESSHFQSLLGVLLREVLIRSPTTAKCVQLIKAKQLREEPR